MPSANHDGSDRTVDGSGALTDLTIWAVITAAFSQEALLFFDQKTQGLTRVYRTPVRWKSVFGVFNYFYVIL
ncbi:hypothetical protein [Pantoea sp. App145]|uniref:hypothetical protein n=1 Tax=Pantoea sp. App145 TaxID=3071567 RepID=UPI003A805B81